MMNENEGTGGRRVNVSPLDIRNARPIKVSVGYCPECRSTDLRYGSRDPCEGDAYWCARCGYGPIWFPIGEGPRRAAPVIDAESEQRKAWNASTKGKVVRPLIIAEEDQPGYVKPSPHEYLDKIIADLNREKKIIDACIAKTPNMPEVEQDD